MTTTEAAAAPRFEITIADAIRRPHSTAFRLVRTQGAKEIGRVLSDRSGPGALIVVEVLEELRERHESTVDIFVDLGESPDDRIGMVALIARIALDRMEGAEAELSEATAALAEIRAAVDALALAERWGSAEDCAAALDRLRAFGELRLRRAA